MQKEDIISKIDRLTKGPVYIIDIFPNKVPSKPDNRYFEFENFIQNNREEIDWKFMIILLKLYCYYDFWVSSCALEQDVFENPDLSHLIGLAKSCFMGKSINIILPECDSMIVLNGDDLYMSVYNPNDHLKSLISDLSQSEGLFFREVPEESK